MKIIGIVGAAGSGKDTVAAFLKSKFDIRVGYLSTPIKQIAIKYYDMTMEDCYTQKGKSSNHIYLKFLDGSPMTNRNVLEMIGDKMQDIDPVVLIRYIERHFSNLDKLIIPDLRTKPQEEYIKSREGIIVYVKNSNVEKFVGDHHTAEFFKHAEPDIIIENNGTMEKLKEETFNKIKEL